MSVWDWVKKNKNSDKLTAAIVAVFCVPFAGMAIYALTDSSPQQAPAGSHQQQAGHGPLTQLPDGKDATYKLVDWVSGTDEATWEMSNGYLIKYYNGHPLHQQQVESFKSPHSNCIGYQWPGVGRAGIVTQDLICQATSDEVIDGYTENGARMQYAVHRGDVYSLEVFDGKSPHVARVKRQ